MRSFADKLAAFQHNACAACCRRAKSRRAFIWKDEDLLIWQKLKLRLAGGAGENCAGRVRVELEKMRYA